MYKSVMIPGLILQWRQEKERRGQDTATLPSKRRHPVAERPAAKRARAEMPPPKVPQKKAEKDVPKEAPMETWNLLVIAWQTLVWVFVYVCMIFVICCWCAGDSWLNLLGMFADLQKTFFQFLGPMNANPRKVLRWRTRPRLTAR